MASNYSVIFPTTINTQKIVFLPAAASVPGRILFIKDICGNAPTSSIFISTAAGDLIDFQRNILYAKLSTFATAVKLASNGINNWMVLSQYTDAIGARAPPAPAPPPSPPWTSVRDGDGTVTNNGGGNWYLTGPNDGGGNGWSYITKQFSSSGSFTFNYTYLSDDSPGYDWAFQFISSSDLSVPGNVNFYSDRFALNSGSSGSKTASYSANQWVAIGLFASDSCCGRAYLTLSGIPT